ncbi:MAG TPA: WhiB family transcriptional regulator [Pseudonocardiaceae bacterium]|nr:WhiB family transcriptional regulator [Pseudonocardiaceae bacterium]
MTPPALTELPNGYQDRPRRGAKPKAVCRSCPVLRQCRAHALAVREPYGIWGGPSRLERGRMACPTALVR